jgi:hypothetical protein
MAAVVDELAALSGFNRYMWHPAIKAAGITPSRESGFHQLRHDYTSVPPTASTSALWPNTSATPIPGSLCVSTPDAIRRRPCPPGRRSGLC